MAHDTANTAPSLSENKAVLRDLISYQDGSVVSRTIVDRKTGTVTLFAFDKNQGLSEHTAPFDALVQILDGEAIIAIAGKDHHLSAGEAILMPAGKPHSLRCDVPFIMLLIMIKEKPAG